MKPLVIGGWLTSLGGAAAVRIWRAGTLPANHAEQLPLLERPLHHPPLLELVTALIAPDRRLAVALLAGLATVALVGWLVRRSLGDGASVAAMGLAAVAPPLVFTGSWWAHESLTAALALGTAALLVRVLDDGPSPGRLLGLTACGVALGASAWVGVAPLFAWTSWVLVFAPWWLEPERALAAGKALAAASVLVGLGYAALLAMGGDPRTAMGASRVPTGLAALQAHMESVAGLLLGRVGRYPLPARGVLAAVTVGLAALGWRRTAPEQHRQSAWAGTLAVGAGGGYVVALFMHPWIPVATDKSLWVLSPLLLCLAFAALWPASAALPRRRGALAPLLLVLVVGCTDADGDGVFRQAGDCDDESASVYPGAPEVWGDGTDNDCDGVIDDSPDYRYLEEVESNDTSLGGCFAPDGQPLGDVAAFGLLNRLQGRIDSVVDDSYDDGDRDCYQLRFPDDAGHPRLEIRLSWEDEASDLDFAVQGLWEGEQSGFALQDQPGPGPEFAVTSSGFDGGESLWVWVIGYSGPPTDYTLDLVLR